MTSAAPCHRAPRRPADGAAAALPGHSRVRRARRVVVLLVLVAVLGTLGATLVTAGPVSSAAGGGVAASVAGSAAAGLQSVEAWSADPRALAWSSGTLPAAGPPGREEDFARLPGRCYTDAGPSPVVSRCRVTRFADRPWLVVWGDSHALMYLPAIRRQARADRVNLVVTMAGSCPVSRPFPRTSGEMRVWCDRHNTRTLHWLRSFSQRHSDLRILIGGFWAGYRHDHRSVLREQETGEPSGLTPYRAHLARLGSERARPMFRAIGRLGVSTDVIAGAAVVPLRARPCARGEQPYQCDVPRRRAVIDERATAAYLARLASSLPGAPRLVDPLPAYCDDRTCYAHVDGVDTWYDGVHLGADLTQRMRPYFAPVFDDLLGR